MKTRKCFVSNSSTSSFVISGFLIDEGSYDSIIQALAKEFLTNDEFLKAKELCEEWEDTWGYRDGLLRYNISILGGDGVPNGQILIGGTISDTPSDDWQEFEEIGPQMIEKVTSRIAKAIGIEQKPKLYIGTRPC